MTSEIKVNTIKKNDGSTITIGENGDTVTSTPGITAASLTSGTVPTARLSAVPNSSLANSAITINGSAVSLGGSVTVGETKPTISSISPTVITNNATNVTINGANYDMEIMLYHYLPTDLVSSRTDVNKNSSSTNHDRGVIISLFFIIISDIALNKDLPVLSEIFSFPEEMTSIISPFDP